MNNNEVTRQILGIVGMSYKNDYSASVEYKRGNVVVYDGSSYVAKKTTRGNLPTNTEYFQLIARKPIKGTDYFTEEDIDMMVERVTEDAESEFNRNVVEKTNEFNSNATSKTSAFDLNAEQKATTFNNNASSKTSEFNTNATNKTSAYNSNAESKVSEFNTNASAKTTSFDTNASDKTTAFNSNATSKTNDYDTNANTKLEAYNTNHTTKLNEYNTNHTSKMGEYNTNAENKVNEFDEHVDELEERVEVLETVIDGLPKVEGEGTDIQLKNTIESPLKMKLDPSELEQETTNGYNMFRIADGVYNAGGAPTREITIKDGVITNVNYSTATEAFGVTVPLVTPVTLKANQSYTRANLQGTYPYINLRNGTGDIDTMGYSNNGIKTFTPTEDVVVDRLFFWFVIRNYTEIKPIMVKGTYTSETLPEFEKGTDGASPNPSYPQQVKRIWGDNELKVENKNLFAKSKVPTSTITITGTDEEFTITKKGNNNNTQLDIKFEENKQYTFSGSYSSTKANGSIRITYTDNTTENVIGVFDNSTISKTAFQLTSNASKSVSMVEFRIFGADNDFTLYNFQIEQNSSKTTYEVHKEQLFPLNLGELEYCAIDDYKDEFFYNSSKREDYIDTLEDGKWYLKKNVGKVVLDGSESWWKSALTFGLTTPEFSHKPDSICSHFINSGATWGSDNPVYRGKYTIKNGNSQIKLMLIDETITEVENFKVWLSTHNTIVYYVLATPEYILLNDTLQKQLTNIAKALSYDEETNISQENEELPFQITASTLRDINSMFESLETRIAELETA